jgi:membrane protein
MANPALSRFRKLQERAQALWEDRDLPLPDEPDLSPIGRVFLFGARVYHGFVRNRCPVRAAALAYTNLLALVPLLAVVLSVSASFIKSQGQQSIQDWVKAAITRAAPSLGLQEAGGDALNEVTSQMTSYVANFQSGTLGVTGVLAFIFVAISLLATVETTLNDIWGVTRGRGWFARIVHYWAALTLGPLCLFSAVTLTTWANVSHRVEQVPLVRVLMPFVVPLVILIVGCTLLYVVMPNTKVSWRAAWLGGSVAGLLLQLNSYYNVMYLSRVVSYKQIYGSMAVLPLLLLGLYFSWLLVLLGAQVTYAFQNRQAYVQERKAEIVSQRGREFVAVRLMTRIAHRFHDGAQMPTALEMAEGLKVPLRLVGQILSALCHAGLVHEVISSENSYAPSRPLDQITIRDVLRALRTGQGQDLATCDDPARLVVQSEFQAIEQAWEKVAGAATFKELVQRIADVQSVKNREGAGGEKGQET